MFTQKSKPASSKSSPTRLPPQPSQNLVDQLTQSRALTSTLQSSVASSRLQLSSEKNLRLKLERTLTSSKSENSSLQTKINDLQKQLKASTANLREKTSHLEGLKSEVEAVKSKFEAFKNEERRDDLREGEGDGAIAFRIIHINTPPLIAFLDYENLSFEAHRKSSEISILVQENSEFKEKLKGLEREKERKERRIEELELEGRRERERHEREVRGDRPTDRRDGCLRVF